eukprot:3661547-Heterocapsa_arctica.AAC.1
MAAPRCSASSLLLSAMGSTSASLFLRAAFASGAGPRVSGPALGLWALPGAPSTFGPIGCNPELPGGCPWGVAGAGRAGGAACVPGLLGASAALCPPP